MNADHTGAAPDAHPDAGPDAGPDAMSDPATTSRYLAPDRATRRIFNPLVSRLVRLGIGLRGGRILHVRGRSTGEWRTTPVNPLPLDGATYLVAPRGHTQWVRNLRVTGEGRLQKGRRITEFTAVELTDDAKPPVIREYLRLWAFEVGKFFDGLSVDSTDDDLLAAAPGFPVFRIETA